MKNKLRTLFIFLLALQAVVNLIGALSPELAFDALWYHLTFPKLYLLNHTVYHIPGGLLFYSDMPKLGEMFYTVGLSFGNEIIVKLMHYLFSILICVTLYKFSREYVSSLYACISVIIFFSNIVVAWEATTAYIDLIRTFFEFLALSAFLLWSQSEKKKYLVLSALLIGFAITTKLLAVGTLGIFLFLIIIRYISIEKIFSRKDLLIIHVYWKKLLNSGLLYFFLAIVIPLPWFIFSYVHTGNPVYPFFTPIYQIHTEPLSVVTFINDLWHVFTQAADPISPIYLIFLPLIIITFSNLRSEIKLITIYCTLSLIFWYFTPRTGGGRFLLPYLPAYSFICAYIYSNILKKSRISYRYLSSLLFFAIIFVALSTIGYRSLATLKYLPVIFGHESKETFLANNLEFSFADFYDTDGYFEKNIKNSDRVLLYGFHNLYYVNFSFLDASWVKSGDTFTHVATQRVDLPPRFSSWELVYKNEKTLVKLYEPPPGECNRQCKY